MGTQSAPNLVITLIDISDGLPETGLAVVVVPYGGSLGVDDVVLTEIGVTGKYKKSEAVGVDAVTQGVYEVYADSGGGYIFRGTYLHGGDALEAHRINTADPHSVTAQQVSLTDVGGYFTGADLETALQEVGLAMEDIGDLSTALLLSSVSQSVSAVKPKVTNLNADKVDGYHAGNAANNLVVLDSDGKVPAANLPAAGQPFAGDADTLDGHDQGQASGEIPIWNSAASHNDLDTSLKGKKVTGLNGHLVAISSAASAPVANKLHTTFLQKKYPLVGYEDGLQIQAGWGYVQGDGSQYIEKTGITFDEEFVTDATRYPIVIMSPLYRSNGVPTGVEDFTGIGAGEIISVHSYGIWDGGFSVSMRNATNFDASKYYGFTYIALSLKK